MPAIGLVDDRQDIRETTLRQIEMALPSKWSCIDIDPFPEFQDYNAWIIENKISVLILDQRLHEQVSLKRIYPPYNGHELVDYLRKCFPTIPIYIVSTYIDDEDIKKRFSDVEELVLRKDFTELYKQYVPRMIRSAQQYLASVEEELTSLAQLSQLVAIGKASSDDLDRLDAVRQKLNLIFPSEVYISNHDVLNELLKILQKIQSLKPKIQKHLRKKSE